MMTASLISLFTAGFVVFGIIAMTFIAVDAVHQVVWKIVGLKRDDRD